MGSKQHHSHTAGRHGCGFETKYFERDAEKTMGKKKKVLVTWVARFPRGFTGREGEQQLCILWFRLK